MVSSSRSRKPRSFMREMHVRTLFTILSFASSMLGANARPASSRPWPAVYDDMPFMSDYSTYHICDGMGGHAKEEAAAVFVDPFVGIDLSTVPFEVFDRLRMVHEEAEDIEIEEFDPAIEDAGEDTTEGKALYVGKIKNRVLYATAKLQAIRIKVAVEDALHIDDPWRGIDIDESEGYHQWVVDADRLNEGLPSKGVV